MPDSISPNRPFIKKLNSPTIAVAPFFIFLALEIYLPFKYDLIPLQDLPNHLANVRIFLNYGSSAFFQQYFAIHYFPYPYLLQDVLLSVFMTLGGANFAASLFVALVTVSIPMSVFYLIKVIHPDKIYLAYFSLPFIWNILLFRGTLNYLLAMSIAFICLAILWKMLFPPNPDKKRLGIYLTIGVILLYFAHLVAFLLFALSAAIAVFHRLQGKNKWRFLISASMIAATALMVVLIIFQGHLPAYSFTDSLSGKWGEAAKVFSCLQQGDYYFLIPVFVVLFFLIIPGLCRIKKHPIPFMICGILGVLYFIVPYDLKPLVKPHERIFYMAVFMLPLCCTGQKFLHLEKAAVILVCSITFLYSYHHADTRIRDFSPYLDNARTLLRKIPPEKKLFLIRGDGLSVGHIEAYYVVDNNGYVPTLFSAPYMLVQYRQKPDITTSLDKITTTMIIRYDYVLVWKHNENVSAFLNKINFVMIDKMADFEIYKNTVSGK